MSEISAAVDAIPGIGKRDDGMVVIPGTTISMDGTNIQESGMLDIRANRVYNIAQGLPPMDKDRDLKGRIAVVGYGPSLNETWERLRDFDTIITVSKAHDFLVGKGVIPTYHLDVDPRRHKGEFTNLFQKATRYYLSTHVHPSYVDKIKAAGVEVRLFNVAIDEHEKLDPRYPAMKVRFDAGIQAAEFAFQRGHREQHWFGIEYGRRGAATHAGYHGGTVTPNCLVDLNGQLFESTKMFVHGLLLAEEYLCDRALAKVTIHGDGLLGHFLKARGRAKVSVLP